MERLYEQTGGILCGVHIDFPKRLNFNLIFDQAQKVVSPFALGYPIIRNFIFWSRFRNGALDEDWHSPSRRSKTERYTPRWIE